MCIQFMYINFLLLTIHWKKWSTPTICKKNKPLRHWPVASPTSPWCVSTVLSRSLSLKVEENKLDLFEWIAVSAKLSFFLTYFGTQVETSICVFSVTVSSLSQKSTWSRKKNAKNSRSAQSSRPHSRFGAWKTDSSNPPTALTFSWSPRSLPQGDLWQISRCSSEENTNATKDALLNQISTNWLFVD